MAGSASMQGYNNLSQYRKDTWSGLEEAAERLASAVAGGRPVDAHVAGVNELMDRLSPVEKYFAFPGPQALLAGRRLFTAEKYTRFARAVASVNRALVTDSFRNGQAWSMAAAIPEPLDRNRPSGSEPGEPAPLFRGAGRRGHDRVAGTRLARGAARWRRPDDEFIYEIVVVPATRTR